MALLNNQETSRNVSHSTSYFVCVLHSEAQGLHPIEVKFVSEFSPMFTGQ